MIKKCDCKHKFQDEKYGKGMRVHSQATSKGGWYRCTVCGKEKNTKDK